MHLFLWKDFLIGILVASIHNGKWSLLLYNSFETRFRFDMSWDSVNLDVDKCDTHSLRTFFPSLTNSFIYPREPIPELYSRLNDRRAFQSPLLITGSILCWNAVSPFSKQFVFASCAVSSTWWWKIWLINSSSLIERQIAPSPSPFSFVLF